MTPKVTTAFGKRREAGEDSDERYKSDRHGGPGITKGMDIKQREAEQTSLSLLE